MTEVSEKDFKLLAQWDTPTICNGLEIIDPKYASIGFTTQNMICSDPTLPPIVGFAKTATIRSRTPSTLSNTEQKKLNEEYYRHMAETPGPTISIIEDLDSPPGFGAWWGEVHTTIHQALGGLGVVTNGAIRDLDDCARGFQMLAGSIVPSHGYVHAVEVSTEVTVFSMTVRPGDIIHADQHGAVVIPKHLLKGLPGAIELLMNREGEILKAARTPQFTVDKLLNAMTNSKSIYQSGI
jgi:regulator of RNase E activity RraA